MRTTLVTDYLDDTAEKYPDKVAFIDDNGSLTFSQLRYNARCIASVLAGQNFFKKPVAVYLEKSPACIAAFMGAAYSGNFYTPIDVKMPASRVEKIMGTLEPVVIITDQSHAEAAKTFAGASQVLLYEELCANQVDEEILSNIRIRMVDTDVLYVLFTSGSTGNPKGVIIGHRSVIDYTEWVTDTFDIDETYTFGNQAPLYFDLSIQDVYAPLKTGATTYLIDEKKFSFPVNLFKELYEQKVDIIFWVPTALCMIANLRGLRSKVLPPFKKILFCGEVMPNRQLNQWRKAYPDTQFVNLYGPTEVTEVCTYFPIERDFSDEESLPVGFPCQNCEILVLNAHNQLVTDDEIGELCVRGTCLSYGYYKSPEKTAEAFVQNPLNSVYPELVYRTGDLVRYNERGELMYVCRKDYQIKHLGHRIELGEIETAVSAITEVDANVCLYDDKKSRIVLFYTGTIEEKTIGKRLHEMLPEYMLPNKRIKLDQMPLNLNGKIDRVELKKQM